MKTLLLRNTARTEIIESPKLLLDVGRNVSSMSEYYRTSLTSDYGNTLGEQLVTTPQASSIAIDCIL
jgi:hypothetical protein